MLAMKGHHLDEASGAGPGRGFEASARKRRLPGSLRAAGFAILGMVLVFVGGFALFATHVSRLSTPEDPPVADAIIVLTGGQARLDAAIGLLKLGKGERLLLYTNNKNATRSEFIAFAREQHASELMIPAEVIFMEKLPMLGSGKPDLLALAKMAKEERAAQAALRPVVPA